MVDTMGFLHQLTGGLIGEDPNAPQTPTPEGEGGSKQAPTDNTDTSGEDNNAKKEEREAYLSRLDKGRAGFTLHQGDIIETHTYDKIYDTSWDYDYEGMESSGSISIPFHKEDLQYIYKGVRCLLKTKRFAYDANDSDIKIDDSEGYLCFITDVNISDDKIELSLNGYDKLLEQEEVLSFTNQRRSTILEEVIKMAGLEPVVDVTGLPDERINWSTEKEKESETDSGGFAGESSSFTDCSTTYELSCVHHDTGSMKKGYIPDDIDSKTEYIATIGKTGTNYAEYVNGLTTACDVVKKLRSGYGYRRYRDNPYYKCVEQVFDNRNAINCADSAKLVKCCMDVCGIPCVIIHGHKHYFNAVKVNNKWYNVDLCFNSTIGQAGSTNTLGC